MADMNNDAPLRAPEDDRLGFAPVAEYLARTLLVGGGAESFVLGVEGEWGSGKTTLVNLALDALEAAKDAPQIIRFEPWLAGTREALLGELFALLQETLATMGETGKTAAQLLEGFAKVTRGASVVLSLLGQNVAAQVVQAGASAAEAAAGSRQSLEAQKKGLTEALAKLPRKLIVFIDDLDRLDPGEAAEVLRLVRAVADFPNITYVLAYDRGILARNLETALRLPTGAGDDYIEKIVQVTFEVPKPEAFDLRNWFEEEARKLLQGAIRYDGEIERLAVEADDRLKESVDTWVPAFLKTPRDVVRTLNALHLYAAPQMNEIDPGDMIFLQIIRLKHPKLYAWVEHYVRVLDNAIMGYGEDEAGRKILLEQIEEILPSSSPKDEAIWVNLSYQLRGFPESRPPDNSDRVFALFKGLDRDERVDDVYSNRLTSPHGHRTYFSPTKILGGLTKAQVEDFISCAMRDRLQTGRRFADLLMALRPQGGNLGEVLLDHLRINTKFNSARAEAVLWGISAGMDLIAYRKRFDFLSINWRAPFWIFRSIDEERRIPFLKEFFAESSSLAWLLHIAHQAIREHGGFDEKPQATEDRFFTDQEFEALREAFILRLRKEDPRMGVETRSFALFLSVWAEADDKDAMQAWVRAHCENDKGLIEFLQQVCRQSGGVQTDRRFFATLFNDPREIRQRLYTLVNGGGELAADARSLLTALETEL